MTVHNCALLNRANIPQSHANRLIRRSKPLSEYDTGCRDESAGDQPGKLAESVGVDSGAGTGHVSGPGDLDKTIGVSDEKLVC